MTLEKLIANGNNLREHRGLEINFRIYSGICRWCKEIFWTAQRNSCCSHACSGNWRWSQKEFRKANEEGWKNFVGSGKYYSCPQCSKQIYVKPSWFAHVEKRKHGICCSVKCFSKWLHNPKNKFCVNRKIDKHGYVAVYEDEKWISEHCSVMQKRLKRKLFRFELVHHKNGIRGDNKDSNLELCAISYLPHRKGHPPGQRIKDLIKFVAKYYPAEMRKELK